jgi:hypothetical protein
MLPASMYYGGGAAAAPAPTSFGVEAPANFQPGNGKCPTIYDLKLRVFASGNAPTIARQIALSDSPPAGMYWRVLQLDAVDTNISAAIPIGFFLTPPGLQLKTPLDSQVPNFLPFLQNVISLGAGQQFQNIANTQTIASQGGGSTAPVSMNPIYVPSGWQLGAYELETNLNANAVQLFLRVLYVEVSNDVPLSL